MWQLLHTNNWTDWLPIYCWLVEHPEGPFLIDAGEIVRVHEYGYLPDNIFFNGAAKYEVKLEDEVDYQLAKLGYKVEQVKGVMSQFVHIIHSFHGMVQHLHRNCTEHDEGSVICLPIIKLAFCKGKTNHPWSPPDFISRIHAILEAYFIGGFLLVIDIFILDFNKTSLH